MICIIFETSFNENRYRYLIGIINPTLQIIKLVKAFLCFFIHIPTLLPITIILKYIFYSINKIILFYTNVKKYFFPKCILALRKKHYLKGG